MDIRTPLVANLEAAAAVQPPMRAFYDPPIAAQALRRLDPPPRNAGDDTALSQCGAIGRRIIAFVGMQLLGPLARPTPWAFNRLHGIHHFLHHRYFGDIGGREEDRERDPVAVDHKMALRARFAAIRWIRPGFFAPPGAATVAASIAARLQSI